MRYIGFLSLAISTALFSLGCENNHSSTKPSDSKMANTKGKIKEAAEATAEAVKTKRDEYVRDMDKKLDELNVKYEEWKTKALKAEGQAKIDLEKKLDEAKVKHAAAIKKLTELKKASADQWEKVKEGAGSAFDDLKKIFE